MTVAVLGEALIDFIVGDDGAYRPHLGGSPYNVDRSRPPGNVGQLLVTFLGRYVWRPAA